MSNPVNGDREDLGSAGPRKDDDCGCATFNCCGSDRTQSSSTQRKLRTALFAVILLSAAAVAAYSLMISPASNKDMEGPAEGTVVNRATADAEGQQDSTNGVSAKADFTFVILAATSNGPGAQIETVVEKAVRSVAEQGVKVTIHRLLPGDPDFNTTTAKYGIADLPAVLVRNENGAARLVEGEISEVALLKAYLSCCAPSSPCCPEGDKKTGCNPAACAK